MELESKRIETTNVKIKEDELFEVIKEYLKDRGVKDTDKHVVIDFKKEVVEGYDRYCCDVVIKKYEQI